MGWQSPLDPKPAFFSGVSHKCLIFSNPWSLLEPSPITLRSWLDAIVLLLIATFCSLMELFVMNSMKLFSQSTHRQMMVCWPASQPANQPKHHMGGCFCLVQRTPRHRMAFCQPICSPYDWPKKQKTHCFDD